MASVSQNNSTSKKRRFQPPITSFFVPASAEENSGLSYNSYAAPTNTPTPSLPSDILSSLLGVGARVRKSVPEGYKTEQKKMTQYTIPAPTYHHRHTTESSTHTQPTRVYAELEPFCGLHKVGNYAVQTFPRPAEDYQTAVETDELESISIPSSSQDSNASSSSFSGKLNKRSLDSDIEDEDDVGFPTTFDLSGDIWQNRLNMNAVSGVRSQRTILSPKLGQQRRQRTAHLNSWKGSFEQENTDPLVSMSGHQVNIDDFGEAAFLRRREEVDADYLWTGTDVEMT